MEVVLVNSNPATIMTDNAMADHIYIEPLTLDTVKRIIEKEKPDSMLSDLGRPDRPDPFHAACKGRLSGGAQRNACSALPRRPSIRRRTVRCSRIRWKASVEPCIPSKVVTTVEDALDFAEEITLPGYRPPGVHAGRHRRRYR